MNPLEVVAPVFRRAAAGRRILTGTPVPKIAVQTSGPSALRARPRLPATTRGRAGDLSAPEAGPVAVSPPASGAPSYMTCWGPIVPDPRPGRATDRMGAAVERMALTMNGDADAQPLDVCVLPRATDRRPASPPGHGRRGGSGAGVCHPDHRRPVRARPRPWTGGGVTVYGVRDGHVGNHQGPCPACNEAAAHLATLTPGERAEYIAAAIPLLKARGAT